MTNKRLLLISLRDSFLDSDRVMPPLGIMSLHSYMLSLGFLSYIENDFDLNNMEKYDEYTHFAISCMTPQKIEAYEILHKIKSIFKDKIVIIGGPHANYYLEDCIKEPFDYIVVGDGEIALRLIMEGKARQRVLNIQLNEEEMNSLPIPYREPSFLKNYEFSVQGIKTSTILTAKGCPMRCAFCEDAGTKVRLYQPLNIDRQIKDVLEAGFKGVMFYDDIFAISKKRVRELIPVIKKHNIVYRCFGHAKSMDEEMAEMLSESGCIEIGFGAESGSQKILDTINKRTKVTDNIRFIETCNKYGIKVKAFIIIGLPGEDLSSIKETARFLDILISNKFTSRLGNEITNDFDITVYFPYKGTEIRNTMLMDNNIKNGNDYINVGSDDDNRKHGKQNKKYDIFFTKNPDEMVGFYKGKGGSAEITVRTSALSSSDISEIQRNLLAEYKKRVIV
jgi:radical SAM superfamily enzyme YgiQ (UPF0313 family)